MRVRPSIKPHAATDGTRVRLPPPPRKLPARIGTATGRVAEQATKATHGKKTAMQFTETEQLIAAAAIGDMLSGGDRRVRLFVVGVVLAVFVAADVAAWLCR